METDQDTTMDTRPEETTQTGSAKSFIKSYLLEHLPVYRDLCEVRESGHENEHAEAFFQKQRTRADHANEKTQRGFFLLMQSIGFELDNATSALKIHRRGNDNRPAILDLCMAPGGFSLAALQKNQTRSPIIRGISLPPSQGGHNIRLRDFQVLSSRVGDNEANSAQIVVDYRDITLLADEMDIPLCDIPSSHPDAGSFSSDRPYLGREFDLVFCDGQVLRTHERGEHRTQHEAIRLTTSQLVLGLQRIRTGGTMVILMHRADTWPSIRLIHTFSRFSDTIQLFKPMKGHRMRSSFYLIAKGVNPATDAAGQAIKRWKSQWKIATFGIESEAMKQEELDLAERTAEERVEEVQVVLDEFGSEILRLTEPVFRIQAEALRAAPWMKNATRNTSMGNAEPRR